MCRNRWIALLLWFALPAWSVAADYDPLQLPADAKARTLDLTVQDNERKRDLPIRVYLPDGTTAAAGPSPVVLFSHGLGGSRQGSSFLGQHWATRGYVCVFLQHPGSDEQVWKDQPLARRFGALQSAASAENFMLRVRDVAVVLDRLAEWNAAKGHELSGRLDMNHVGMSGHSFGAQTTQAVSGQSMGKLGPRVTDKRIRAAIIMSPGVPKRGEPKDAFGSVAIPWLLMTGTNDTARIGGQTVESRQAVFPALPAGNKYQLVLSEAEHSVFTDRRLPADRAPRNPNHHRVILALSTAFWDAFLRGDADAKAWLDGKGPASVLEEKDRWQTK